MPSDKPLDQANWLTQMGSAAVAAVAAVAKTGVPLIAFGENGWPS